MYHVTECLPGWSYFSNKCYAIFKQSEGITWLAAEGICGGEGGHLVSMATEAETMFVHSLQTKDISNIMNSTQQGESVVADTDLDYYIGE